MGASLPTADFEIFWNFDKVKKVITLESPQSATCSRPPVEKYRDRRVFRSDFFQKIFKVQKVITLEHPRSADPFGPSIGTRHRWANLFPLRTLKYFEILTKSKRWLRWKIRNRRVVLDLPVERPSWARLFPLRTLKYFEILTKSKRWLRWKMRNRQVVLDLPVERPSWARLFPLRTLKYFEIFTKSKRWLRWKIRNRRVLLDLPVERPSWARLFPMRTLKNVQSPRGHHGGKSLVRRWFSTQREQRDPRLRILLDPPVERDPHRRVILELPVERDPDCRVSSHYGLWNSLKFWQSPKGDYAGRSAIGESFSTWQSRDLHGRVSSHCGLWNILKFWQSPKGDYAGRFAFGELFSTCRSRNTAIGGSFGRTLFQKIFKVQKVITLGNPRPADPFGPSIGTRPRWANLFPLRTLKYFEILTKSKRWLRWKTRNRRVVLYLPVERPSWARLFPPRTLKYFEILTKSKRWLRWKIRNRRVILDRPVGKYRNRRVFRSEDTFSKKFSKSKKKKTKSYLHITTVRKLSSRPTFLSHRQDEVRVRPRPGFFFLFFRSCNFYAQNVHRCLLDALWKFRPDPSTRCGSKLKKPPPGTSFCHFSSFLASFGWGKDFLAILWQFPTERNRDLFDIARLPDSTCRPPKKRAHVLTGLYSFTPFERLGDEFARPSTGFDSSLRATGFIQVPFDAYFDAESDSATIFHKCRKGGKWHAKKPIFPPLKCPGPNYPPLKFARGTWSSMAHWSSSTVPREGCAL